MWKYQKFDASNLRTVRDELVVVHSPGLHNVNSGPDFFNGKVSIDEVQWAGNIEIHILSSYWYMHKHHTDEAYDNVILHVVWQHDLNVYRNDGSEIPTVELQHWVSAKTVAAYKKLFRSGAKWIPCERDFHRVDKFILKNWLERLFFERLEKRTDRFAGDLLRLNNDWEAIFFIALVTVFGTKVNGESFRSIAQSVDFTIIRKCSAEPMLLEALLLGQAGLLDIQCEDTYLNSLQAHYQFLKLKFGIHNDHVVPPKFFRLRPNNFPTIRLSQLATLYTHHAHLFSAVIDARNKLDYYRLFRSSATAYWDTHYNFGKPTQKKPKMIHSAFIDLLLINVVLPLKFLYLKTTGNINDEEIIELSQSLKSEENNIILKFKEIGISADNLLESQALLQLKSNYCEKKKCLQCAIGNKLIHKKL